MKFFVVLIHEFGCQQTWAPIRKPEVILPTSVIFPYLSRKGKLHGYVAR